MQDRVPQISIGMPVYNGELYIEEAIDAILKQTFKDFELIISDNASTDNTKKICETYVQREKRVKYIRNSKNLGAAKNYNQVFELSQGKYFKWAAIDDYCDPQMLETCFQVLERNPDVVLCYPKTKIIDETGNIKKNYEHDLDLRDSSACKRFIKLSDSLKESNAIFGLIRKDALEKTVLIGNYIASDNVLLHQLSLLGKFWLIKDCFFYRREHQAASSWDRSIKNQLKFFDPQKSQNIAFPHWRRFYAISRCVHIMPMSWREKTRLYNYLLLKTFRFRRKLIKDIIIASRMQFKRLKS